MAPVGFARAQGPALDPELDAGIRQVDEGNFEIGIAKLDAVARRLKAEGDRPLQLSRAYLYLGIAHLRLSQEQAARARFAEAARADQNLKLSEYEFPPPVIRIFEEARRAVVEAAPSPAVAVSDGPSIFDAAKAGDVARIQALLKTAPDVAALHDTAFGGTPLHWAALRGQLDAARVLLEGGADVGAENNDGETPLEVAHRANHRDVETLLARASKTPKARLFAAAREGDAGAVRKLLEQQPGLVLERDTAFGATALHWAALRGHADVVKLLLKRGAVATAVNAAGETPLDVAIRAKRQDIVRALSQ
jgi:cytohesin